ncbi:hypothetical protein [Paenibacillus agricola]|uniref:Gas vesicle protein n=1 Tax=Paenibacillus agricola TaxID=2716264 RepID=A0ABX0J1J4_9BACL|nr:hypothetical protein [Paenibacillus agricola]NHN28752.1 hypothetical protein [Paenibacillus agricola]
MKMGSFLLGGMVGAAAVIYLNTKNKAMLLSAFSGNNASMGNNMSKAKEKMTGAFDKESHSPKAGFGEVKAIINKEPQLKATFEEILAENADNRYKEMHPPQ